MPTIDLSFAQDPNTLALALLYGVAPAVMWLFFWLRERAGQPHRSGMLAYAFAAGALMVVLALPVEKLLGTFSNNPTTLTIMWAAAEEVLKFGALLLILFTTSALEKPLDYALYAIVIALGFAGFENALYFLQPLQTGDSIVLLLAGTTRFIGTTLMHAVAASLPGCALGLAFYKNRHIKQIAVACGLVGAAVLHSWFNLASASNGGLDFASFGIMWVLAVVILALFERLRLMGDDKYSNTMRAIPINGLERSAKELFVKVGTNPLDARPLPEIFAAKGLGPEALERAEFAAFIERLRAAYSAYLASEGTLPAEIQKAAVTVIPDTISPKGAEGVIAALLRAV